MSKRSILQQDTHGPDETSLHPQSAAPGASGSSESSESHSKTTQHPEHVKTHLKKILVRMACNEELDQEIVKQKFEKYGLKDL